MIKRAALLIGTGCACCLAVVAAGLILSDRAARGNLINEVRLETGSEITVESFFRKTARLPTQLITPEKFKTTFSCPNPN